DPISQSGVAENRDDIFIAAALVARGADAQCRRESSASVGCAIAIVLALATHGKAAQAAGAADTWEARFAPGQELMDVALVADIPNEFVLGCAEDVVEGEGQFDHA